VNWHEYNKLKRPGAHELSALQTIAHGGDTVQYFQFRKSRGAGEQFHGAVVDHEGSENTRVFKEVAALGARMKQLDAVVGTKTVARVAILHDWSNQWALDAAQGFQNKNKRLRATQLQFYKAFWQRGINVDVICPEDDLTAYDLVIAPMLYSVSNAQGQKLAAYVAKGGTLVCTYGTAMVDETTLAHLGGWPGAGLRKVFGIWNEELDTLYPDDFNTVTGDIGEYKTIDYCELIHAEGAEVLATYESDFYAGRPAATVNTYGKGKAYYIAFRDTGDFTDAMMEDLIHELGITSDFDGELPHGVTAHSRTDGESVFVFLQNFNSHAVTVPTAKQWATAEGGISVSGTIPLKPYETVILKKQNIF